MKFLKTITFIFTLIILSCSSDDDSGNNDDMPTTAERLTTGTWYLESKTPGEFSECEKNSSFKFNTNNTVNVEFFDDDGGTCESEGAQNGTYTLSENEVTITLGTETLTITINSISETTLTVTNDVGDVITFDKTQG